MERKPEGERQEHNTSGWEAKQIYTDALACRVCEHGACGESTHVRA